MRIVALMPIKMKNDRLPGKNTMFLGSKPLLQYELDNLMKIEEIERVVVFCSDESIVKYLPYGVEFIKRPAYLDLPIANFTQIFECAMNYIDADIYLYAHATAPFVTIETMKECIDAVVNKDYDSAFCAVKIQDYLWMDGKPLNFDATDIPRTQDLQVIYQETSGIYVFKKCVFEKTRKRIGSDPYIKEVSIKEAIDIDEPSDFALAESMLNVNV